jgi:hypothetical protein
LPLHLELLNLKFYAMHSIKQTYTFTIKTSSLDFRHKQAQLPAQSSHCCMERLSEEITTAMLPALRNIFVAELQRQGERTHGAIQEFIAAKRLAGHPVTLYPWEVDD